MVRCPSCRKTIGGPSQEGGLRVRLAIVLVDTDTGDVHGPCPHCGADVAVTRGGRVADDVSDISPVAPGLPLGGGRRRAVAV